MKRMIAAAMALLCLTGCANPFAEKQLPEGPTMLPTVTTVPTTETAEETTVATTAPEETTVPEETDPVTGMYRDLVEDYRRILRYRLSAGFDADKLESKCYDQLSDTMQQILAADRDGIENVIFELPMSVYQQHEADFGYILHDVNADGVPELFWVREDHSIAAVFTRDGEKMVLLEGFWSRYRGYISQNNAFYTQGSSGAADNDCTVYHLSGGKLKELFRFGMESDYTSAAGYRLFEAVGKEKLDISEDRLTELYSQFPDSPGKFWKSIELCPLDREIQPTDVDGSTTQKPSTKNQRLPFLQKLRRIDRALYSGPGYAYTWLGSMAEVGTYTILTVVTDENGEVWGKLKSGNGWVSLTKEQEDVALGYPVSATDADDRLLKKAKYQHYVVDTDEYARQIAICAHKEIKNVEFYSMDVSEAAVAEQLLFTADKVKSGSFLLVEISFPGDMTTYGIRLTDSDGKSRSYLLADNGFGGIELWEEDFA